MRTKGRTHVVIILENVFSMASAWNTVIDDKTAYNLNSSLRSIIYILTATPTPTIIPQYT